MIILSRIIITMIRRWQSAYLTSLSPSVFATLALFSSGSLPPKLRTVRRVKFWKIIRTQHCKILLRAKPVQTVSTGKSSKFQEYPTVLGIDGVRVQRQNLTTGGSTIKRHLATVPGLFLFIFYIFYCGSNRMNIGLFIWSSVNLCINYNVVSGRGWRHGRGN